MLLKEYILAPISQSNNLKIVTSDNDNQIFSIKFPKYMDFNLFLLECAYCNFNKKLYITGGIHNNKDTNFALSVNLNKNDEPICQLTSMNFARSCHSMIGYDVYLFAVGGKNHSSVERYNIIDNVWEKLNPMNYKRMYPILAIYDDYLYALFGKSNEYEFCNTIERLRLRNNMSGENWQMVQFNNPYQIDTRIYGCAVHIFNNNLYLLGGKCNEIATNETLYWDLEDNTLKKEQNYLGKKDYFRENQLHEIGGQLVQISDNYCGTFFDFNSI